MRNITALSYSDTTLKQINSENGKVTTITSIDKSVARISMHPELCPSAVKKQKCSAYCLELYCLINFSYFIEFILNF